MNYWNISLQHLPCSALMLPRGFHLVLQAKSIFEANFESDRASTHAIAIIRRFSASIIYSRNCVSVFIKLHGFFGYLHISSKLWLPGIHQSMDRLSKTFSFHLQWKNETIYLRLKSVFLIILNEKTHNLLTRIPSPPFQSFRFHFTCKVLFMSCPPIYFKSMVPKRLCDCVTRTTERWSQARLMSWWRKKVPQRSQQQRNEEKCLIIMKNRFTFNWKSFCSLACGIYINFSWEATSRVFVLFQKKIGNSVSEAEKLCFVIKIEVSLPDRAAHPSLSVQIELALIRMERLWRQKQCSARSCSSFIILALHWGGKQETRF